MSQHVKLLPSESLMTWHRRAQKWKPCGRTIIKAGQQRKVFVLLQTAGHIHSWFKRKSVVWYKQNEGVCQAGVEVCLQVAGTL